MTLSETVVVDGDLTVDWSLARTSRGNGAGGVGEIRAGWNPGGAALLAELVERVAAASGLQISLVSPPGADVSRPASAAERRELWDRSGAIVDDLASRVLVLNVAAQGEGLGEWLTNAARHAGVESILVELIASRDRITLRIHDAGRGFEMMTQAVTFSSGLSIMRERAILLTGTFFINSAPGKGTEIRVTVPLNTREGGEDDGKW